MAILFDISSKLKRRVVILSLLLFFFTIPHTLEDFATGEHIKRGIPFPFLALVISIAFALQALGLFWLGDVRRRGYLIQAVIGLFWPIASGFAQLPIILGNNTYRSGFISVFYVGGMIVVGSLLFFSSIFAFKYTSTNARAGY